MTQDEALRIAREFVKDEPLTKDVAYAGVMDGKHLLSIERNTTGHIGMPIYVVVSNNGNASYVEGRNNIFHAMDIERIYLHLD